MASKTPYMWDNGTGTTGQMPSGTTSGRQTSGGKTSGGRNNRYENRYTDAVTGTGVGISKTDYTRPRANAYPNGLGGSQSGASGNRYSKEYTDAIKNGTYTPPGYYRDAFGVLFPGSEPTVGNISQDVIETVAKNMEAKNNTQPNTTTENQQPNTTTPGGGNNDGGGGRVTYIDEDGNAKKGTTEETPTEPQKTYLDDLKDQYQKMYDDAVKANNDAAKAAAERALAQVEQGIGELGDQYGNINKQLYRDYMESLRVLPQEMAARGYSGGMSESARLGLDTAYGERLNENEAARIAAIMQLRQQGADAEYQANAARDQANAEAQQNLYANMINLLLQQQQDAATKAQNMAQYGDFSGYLDLGYSQSQIDAMKKAWIAANPEMAQALGYVSTPSYGSYGGSGGGNNTDTSGTDASGMKPGDQKVTIDGQEFVVNDHGETRFNGNMTRGEIQRKAQQDYAAGEITLAEYNAIIRGLH